MTEEIRELLYGELLGTIDRPYYTEDEVYEILGYKPWKEDTQPSWEDWPVWDQ